MDEELTKMLKYLRLLSLLANWDRYLDTARKGNYSHVRLLKLIVEEEYRIKKENARKMRLNRAKIPEKLVMETFPFAKQPKLNKKKVLSIYDSFDYIKKQQNLIKKFASYDCLVIDELGYVEVEPVQVGLFFTLMHKRHKKKNTIITSNLGFQQWSSFLKNDHLTAALIDRLTENSHVINMRKCLSLRPKLDQT